MSVANSYLKLYFAVIATILLFVGGVNFLVDPLWYGAGNHLTGINLPWNERIAKTNQFLKHVDDYDCLIFGTSRTTLLNSDALKHNRCFNYSFGGAKIEELVTYANYAKQQGAQPTKVYLEVDPESFNRRKNPQVFSEVSQPLPAYRAYFFSFNAFLLSIRTLAGGYDFPRLYDRQFQVRLAKNIRRYEPIFALENVRNYGCDLDRIDFYRALRQAFPNAQFIGFIAPKSAWRLYSEQYGNGLLNCQLAGIYQLARTNQYAAIYDFAVPSKLTTRTDNTYDGTHYYPNVLDQVANVLEGRQSSPGIRVNQDSLETYQQLYAVQLREFLAKAGQSNLWRG